MLWFCFVIKIIESSHGLKGLVSLWSPRSWLLSSQLVSNVKPRWQDIDQWEPMDPAGHVVKIWHVLTRLNDRNNKVSQLPQCLSNVRAIASNDSIHTKNNKFILWHTKMSYFRTKVEIECSHYFSNLKQLRTWNLRWSISGIGFVSFIWMNVFLCPLAGWG